MLSLNKPSAGKTGAILFRGPVTNRPLGHLQTANQNYPGLWRAMDALRNRRSEVGGWPAWCFLPPARAHEAALALGREINAFETAVLGALFAWRATQGVYLFDPTILDELWATPVTGDIPAEALEGLPEWCCYLAFPQPRSIGEDVEIAGFFVLLQYDFEDHQRDLHLVLDATRSDGTTYLAPTGLRLVGNLGECHSASFARMQESVECDGGKAIGFATREEGCAYLERVRQRNREHPNELAPLVSLALYLSSAARELRSGTLTEPVRPKAQMTRHDGPRIFPPPQTRIWEVGYRIGATLRSGQAAIEHRSVPSNGSEARAHAGPRPHIRAAHWHHYWAGPMKGQRRLIVKWLHPILVAAGGNGDEPGIVPTVHRVIAPLSKAGETVLGIANALLPPFVSPFHSMRKVRE